MQSHAAEKQNKLRHSDSHTHRHNLDISAGGQTEQAWMPAALTAAAEEEEEEAGGEKSEDDQQC